MPPIVNPVRPTAQTPAHNACRTISFIIPHALPHAPHPLSLKMASVPHAHRIALLAQAWPAPPAPIVPSFIKEPVWLAVLWAPIRPLLEFAKKTHVWPTIRPLTIACSALLPICSSPSQQPLLTCLHSICLCAC
jgi:hypothetical protein